MEPEPTENPISTACVGDCKGHAADVPNWTQLTVVGGCDTARANVYQVAVAGVGGKATYKDGTDGNPIGGAHGVVAVASRFGHAISGDGGVAVSGGDGESTVGQWGYAYAKGGKAFAGACSVAGTAGGCASAREHGIAVGWFSNTHAARVEAGPGGVAIGDTGCFVKAGKDGVLIAMTVPRTAPAKTPPTKICRVDEGGIMKDQWYRIKEKILECGSVVFWFDIESPPVWKTNPSPCPVPPKV